MTDYVVFVAEPEYISQVIEIEVENEDNINTIKRKIQANCRPDYDLTPIDCILLFESIESAEPLHALTKWNTDVTWGKPETPLIVRVQPSAIAPGNNNSEGCTVRRFSRNDFMNNSSKISSVVHHRESENNQNTATMESFVCYTIMYSDERQSRVTKIKVKEGEYIDSIIRGMKLRESPDFDSVPLSSIELFESIESAEPLDSFTPWNSNVAWGKPETPMIVRVQPLAVAPWKNNVFLNNSTKISSVAHYRESDQNHTGRNQRDLDVSNEHQEDAKKPCPNQERGRPRKSGYADLLGGDVANQIDLLDFIDNEEERTSIILGHVLQNIVPLIIWEDGTTGLDIATIAAESDGWLTIVPKEEDESLAKDDHYVTLSEDTLRQHNAGSGDKQEFKNERGKKF